MKGYILLEGGAEFGGGMAEPDDRAIELAGGFDAPVSIIPTAAAPHNNHEQAGRTGVSWFKKLGAKRVTLLDLIDQASANQDQIVTSLLNSRLIYLLGGFPLYLQKTLEGSLGWQAILKAHEDGAVVGGSSAGAMVMGEHFYDPETEGIITGLTLIPRTCIIPHHNASGRRWVSHLSQALPGDIIIGIDEQTGIIDDGADATWNVYGKGSVTLYRKRAVEVYHQGETFSL